MTMETFTVTADPPQIPADQLASVAAKAAGPLGLPAAQVLDLLQHPTSPDYVKLASGVPASAEDQLEALDLPGLYESGSYARDYPNGDSTANLVGLTSVNPDSDAISGYAGPGRDLQQAADRHGGPGERSSAARPASRSRSPGRRTRPP